MKAATLCLYLLDAVPPAAQRSGWHGVGQMFAHLHTVRLMWLEVAAPELMAGLYGLPSPS